MATEMELVTTLMFLRFLSSTAVKYVVVPELIKSVSPSRTISAVAAAIGLVHGNAHGLEVAATAPAASLAAFACGTALLHAVGYVVARGLAAQTPRALPLAGAVLVCTGGALAFA